MLNLYCARVEPLTTMTHKKLLSLYQNRLPPNNLKTTPEIGVKTSCNMMGFSH